MNWPAYLAVIGSVFQIFIITVSWAQSRRAHRFATATARENRECWDVLVECTKVLEMHDDFDSRHVAGLIRALCNKYSPEVVNARIKPFT